MTVPNQNRKLKFFTDFQMDAQLERLTGDRREAAARELHRRLGQHCIDTYACDGRVTWGVIRVCCAGKDIRTIQAYRDKLLECGALIPTDAGAYRLAFFRERYEQKLLHKMQACGYLSATIPVLSVPSMSPIQDLDLSCKKQEPNPQSKLSPPDDSMPEAAVPVVSPLAPPEEDEDPDWTARLGKYAAMDVPDEPEPEPPPKGKPKPQPSQAPVGRPSLTHRQIHDAVQPILAWGFEVGITSLARTLPEWQDLQAGVAKVIKRLDRGDPLRNPGGYLNGYLKNKAAQRGAAPL